MKRNFKAFGLALVATFAMSAVAASAVQAESVFTATKYPVTFTGEQEGLDVLKLDGGEVKCKKASYMATATGPVQSLTVTPKYSECEAFKLKATIHMNGCTYTFTPGQHTVGKNTFHGTTDIVCPKEKEITITAPEGGNVCVVHVPPQSGINGLTYTNIAADQETTQHYMTVDVKANNFHYTETEINRLLCPGTQGLTGKAGTYEGKAVLKGYEDTGTHESTHTEGNPVGIDVGTVGT